VQHLSVTANQLAHQLLLNRKRTDRRERKIIARDQKTEEENFEFPITHEQLIMAIKKAENWKAVGVEVLFVEQMKHFGATATNLLLLVFNNCISKKKILPRLWK